MPRGASLIFALLACLEPEPNAPLAPHPAPIDVHGELNQSEGSILAQGRVVGSCTGVVRVELVGRAGDALARTEAHDGAYRLGPIGQPAGGIRWGCDTDNDGVVNSEDVAAAELPRVPLTGALLLLPDAPPATP